MRRLTQMFRRLNVSPGIDKPGDKTPLAFILLRLSLVLTRFALLRQRQAIDPLPSTSMCPWPDGPTANPDICPTSSGTNRHRQQCFHLSLRSSNSSDTTPQSRSTERRRRVVWLPESKYSRNCSASKVLDGISHYHDDFQPVHHVSAPDAPVLNHRFRRSTVRHEGDYDSR